MQGIGLAGQMHGPVTLDRSGRARAVPLNVAVGREVDAVFDRVAEEHGRIDILVANAGVIAMSPSRRCRNGAGTT